MQTESTEKETLTCSDSQINHTIEQKIKLFIEQSTAVTPDATVPLSVARRKNKEKKNIQKSAVAFNWNILMLLLQSWAKIKQHTCHPSAHTSSALASQLELPFPKMPHHLSQGLWVCGASPWLLYFAYVRLKACTRYVHVLHTHTVICCGPSGLLRSAVLLHLCQHALLISSFSIVKLIVGAGNVYIESVKNEVKEEQTSLT